MGGPWFTVVEDGAPAVVVERIWISNGTEHEAVRVELEVKLEESEV